MHNHFNGLKTAALFGAIFCLLLLVGYAIGGSTYLWLFGLAGVAMTAYGYWNSDKLAIKAMRAVPADPQQFPQMYRIVQELSQRADQPMPKLFVSPTQAPNAFATGRNPEHAAVCCTEGILQLLDERELRGVLGHELMHVYNRDILTGSVAGAIAGIISSVASIALWFGGRDRNPIAAIAVALLAPVAAMVIQMAISRTREYDADEDGASLTGDPLALASALRNELGKRRFAELLSAERGEVMENIRQGLNREARKYGAEVIDVRIKRADLPPGARVVVRRGDQPVRLARLRHASFAERLVRKFDLPVAGWRGAAEQRRGGEA